jgi:hypothetical protein
MLASLRSAKTFTNTGYQALMRFATKYVKVPDQVLISESGDLAGATEERVCLVEH